VHFYDFKLYTMYDFFSCVSQTIHSFDFCPCGIYLVSLSCYGAYMHLLTCCLHYTLCCVLQIHVDRYKHAVYTHISDPFLRALVTRDATSTRFHACERFERCSFVNVPRYVIFHCSTSLTVVLILVWDGLRVQKPANTIHHMNWNQLRLQE
jgi:hypothetical protein